MLILNLFQSLALSAKPKDPCLQTRTEKQGFEYFFMRAIKERYSTLNNLIVKFIFFIIYQVISYNIINYSKFKLD